MRLLRDESGGSTVELALALPVLLIVLVGAVQFALVHHAQSVAESAVIEGARLAAAEGYTLHDGALRARELLEAGLGPTGTEFVVTMDAAGEAVVTTLAGGYPLFIPWVTRLSVPIEVSAQVRREGFRGGP